MRALPLRDSVNVIYNESHRLHAPSYEFAGGRRTSHPETPARAEAIARALRAAGHPFEQPREYSLDPLRLVHGGDYLDYLARGYGSWRDAGKAPGGVLASVFPVRPFGRMPPAPWRHSGYYCLDTETVLTEHAYEAACVSAACALTGADMLLEGASRVYALCRPPGHHAGRDYCAGYCYVNNAAVAAAHLAGEYGRAAILDVDYHHGNGTQDIFYDCGNVLYVSVHADPGQAYPYYWGYAEETGTGAGEGCNLNLPLPPGSSDSAYMEALGTATDAIASFGAPVLVVSLGTDTAAADRLGSFDLHEGAFSTLGRQVAGLAMPTLVIQEGGYDLRSIGTCVRDFLEGLETG